MSKIEKREWWIKKGSYPGDAWGEADAAFYSCIQNNPPESPKYEKGFIHVISHDYHDQELKKRDEAIRLLRYIVETRTTQKICQQALDELSKLGLT